MPGLSKLNNFANFGIEAHGDCVSSASAGLPASIKPAARANRFIKSYGLRAVALAATDAHANKLPAVKRAEFAAFKEAVRINECDYTRGQHREKCRLRIRAYAARLVKPERSIGIDAGPSIGQAKDAGRYTVACNRIVIRPTHCKPLNTLSDKAAVIDRTTPIGSCGRARQQRDGEGERRPHSAILQCVGRLSFAKAKRTPLSLAA